MWKWAAIHSVATGGKDNAALFQVSVRIFAPEFQNYYSVPSVVISGRGQCE